MHHILIIDNHDSFTRNLSHLIETSTGYKSDIICVDEINNIQAGAYSSVVISPGPGLPEEYPGLLEFIRAQAGTKPMFGVCLGMQAMACAFANKLIKSVKIIHGEPCKIKVTTRGDSLFNCIPENFKAVRYHSWVIDPMAIPDSFSILCRDTDGQVMAIRHKEFLLAGVQFHPESYKTEYGHQMIKNWFQSI